MSLVRVCKVHRLSWYQLSGITPSVRKDIVPLVRVSKVPQFMGYDDTSSVASPPLLGDIYIYIVSLVRVSKVPVMKALCYQLSGITSSVRKDNVSLNNNVR